MSSTPAEPGRLTRRVWRAVDGGGRDGNGFPSIEQDLPGGIGAVKRVRVELKDRYSVAFDRDAALPYYGVVVPFFPYAQRHMAEHKLKEGS